MEALFYTASVVAIVATVLTITRMNAVHALLNLIVSLLAIACVFYSIGAPFVAALEVIIYAGAIMVLFVFVVMMLNLGERAVAMERRWWTPGMWIGPSILSAILLAELIDVIARGGAAQTVAGAIEPRQVGAVLFGPYLLGVEIASMLLLAGMVGAYRIGLPTFGAAEIRDDTNTDERRADSSRNFIHTGTSGSDRAT
ncbi:MAG TPA: NADH-quinone oxidoreductase subunit J [Bryobacteraceae bacterium]|nr:NADH-quinone oxidoreductase subunit J [Bryobacteraceae bacterium]